jgi:hypothetical protein
MVNEIFKAVFLGKSTITIGSFRRDGHSLLAKTPNRFFPFFQHKPVVSNISQHLSNYEERELVNFNDGRTGNTIRLYPFDIDTFTPYYPLMNVDVKREMESLRVERDYLYQKMIELKEMISVAGMDNLVKEQFKSDFDFFTGLRPGFSFNKPDGKKK